MSQTHDTPAALPAIHAARHDGWTPARQATFLRELAACHCVSTAARAVGMSRQSAYALRARLKGEPFDRAWQAALVCRFDVLAEAAMDRALNGVEVPHFYQGELVHTSRRFDERLTVALLAMRASFEPRRALASHPSSDYAPDDFGALVERVEAGPETWDEEVQLQYATWAREDGYALDHADGDEGEVDGEAE